MRPLVLVLALTACATPRQPEPYRSAQPVGPHCFARDTSWIGVVVMPDSGAYRVIARQWTCIEQALGRVDPWVGKK